MNFIKEKLKFREKKYPILKRLPNGTLQMIDLEPSLVERKLEPKLRQISLAVIKNLKLLFYKELQIVEDNKEVQLFQKSN